MLQHLEVEVSVQPDFQLTLAPLQVEQVVAQVQVRLEQQLEVVLNINTFIINSRVALGFLMMIITSSTII